MGLLRPPKLDAHGEAFTALYRRHFGLVWSMTLHLGVPAAAREDVAQEVWLAIHRRLGSLRPDASSRAWVASIARHVAMHHHRTTSRRSRKHSALTVVTDVCERTHKTDALAEIDVALRQMDPAQREAFILVAVEEMSGPEAAEVLGVPVNTVYSRLRLARARLATALTDIDDEQAANALRDAPQQQQAANRVWIALAIDLGWRSAAPATAISTFWTGKLAVVATSALATVVGTAALGGRGDSSAHARSIAAPVEVRAASVVETTASEPAPIRTTEPAEAIAAAAPDPIASTTIATSPRVAQAPRRPTPKAATPTPAPQPEATVAEVVAPPVVETLATEAKLLGLARRALSDGNPTRARALLEQHANQFPNGKLALERRAAWVRMLCAANEPAEAREQLAKLMRDDPTAPAVVAVRDVCKSE
jgi:RNA polymerase sigma-70 factor (ECF subfamily)